MTIRLRLSVLYASLFLCSGVVLLAIAYLLVLRSLPSDFIFARGSDGAVLVGRSEFGGSPDEQVPSPRLLGRLSQGDPQPIRARARELRARAADQRTTDLRRFLIQSGTVLAV